MQRAVSEHHRRAIEGEPGGPIGQPAERIKAVREYDEHPNEYNPEGTMSVDVARSEIDALLTAGGKSNKGVIPLDQLAVEVRNLAHPMVAGKENVFDSNFKMKEKRTVKLDFLPEG
jgi:hypothetical protein